jgi:hypothetical protein
VLEPDKDVIDETSVNARRAYISRRLLSLTFRMICNPEKCQQTRRLVCPVTLLDSTYTDWYRQHVQRSCSCSLTYQLRGLSKTIKPGKYLGLGKNHWCLTICSKNLGNLIYDESDYVFRMLVADLLRELINAGIDQQAFWHNEPHHACRLFFSHVSHNPSAWIRDMLDILTKIDLNNPVNNE